MHRRRTAALLTGVVALTLAGAVPAGARPGPAAAPATAARSSAGDWSTWQKDLLGTRFNAAEHTITPATVGRLKLKWAYAYPFINETVREGSQPAVVGDTLYVGSPDAHFLALDARTGATRWSFDLTPTAGPWDAANQNVVRDGAAVVGDTVYFADSRGWLYALRRDTGRLRWATKLDENPKTWITSSPMVYRGRVIIGVSSTESGITDPNYPCCSHRGSILSLDARTGAIQWRHYTLPPAQQVGTWPSGSAKLEPSGGMVWGSGVVNPLDGTLYFGTGNNHSGSGGDIDSLLALDYRTGALRWKHQFTAQDTLNEWCVQPNLPQDQYCPWKAAGYGLNYDVGATPNLFFARGRVMVGVGQKGGVYHALDARTGATVWDTRLAEEDRTARDPGSVGVPWGSSFDGRRIYVASWRGDPGALHALDPATGRILWKTPVPEDACTTGGAAPYPQLCERAFDPAASSTPGLVYEGAGDGKMRIFSAKDGRILWTYDAVRDFQGVNGLPGHGKSIGANGGAVIAHGMLYVQAGYYPLFPGNSKGTVLLAFGLD